MADYRPHTVVVEDEVTQRQLLVESLDLHDDWNIDLKNRRDPSAHRIPLYVPPAVLNEAEAARHEEIWTRKNGRVSTNAMPSLRMKSRLRTFRPHFFHDLAADGLPIYDPEPAAATPSIRCKPMHPSPSAR